MLKKGTKSVLAEQLKSFGDPVNIAMRKKRKMVALLPWFLLLLLMCLMMMMLLYRNNGNCDLCCKKILDGKEEAVQCEGVCSLRFHRYCAGISATHFQRLSTTNALFVCFTCYQHDQHVLTAQLQSEVVSLKAEIIKLNELISSVPVSNVCVSTDNQSYSGTETRSHVRNKKPVRSPVTREQVSKHQTTAYKSDSSVKNKRETQSHKFTQPSVLSSIPLHPKPSPEKKFNIVLYVVDECAPGMSRSARQESDLSTVAAVLSSLDSSISSQSIRDCLRLRKFSSKSRPRPILVKFRISDVNKFFPRPDILPNHIF